MDSPPKLTGETLIVHHIPLVHCQVPDRQCCSGGKRTNPFCPPELGIARATALSDRDLSQADSLVYSSLLQAAEVPAEAAESQEGKARDLAAPKRHNPFLLCDGDDRGLFGDDGGQKSFHLHSSLVTGKPPFHLHDTGPIVKPWHAASRAGVVDGQEDRLAGDTAPKRHNANRCRMAAERMELDECPCLRGGPAGFSFDLGDAEWGPSGVEEPAGNAGAPRSRSCSCSSAELQACRCYSTSSQSELADQPMGYVSDSSCNSSDGVLVNFSALYHKMSGHSRSNLNSAPLSCDSSFCSHSDTGAFYLDLQPSPTESKMSCESHGPDSGGKPCGCRHAASPVLDANCNSYHLPCEPCAADGSDLTSCFQSQARLVVATQNYYKLVTCDLSSQSSPSPAGSSITSCSEDHTKGSPAQPTEYYLFRRPELKPEEGGKGAAAGEAEGNVIEGQVYVNVSPPNLNTGRQRSRSYDRSLDRSPTSRLGSLERMLSCPVKLSESPALALQSSPPKRVTSFAELAKGRKKNGASPPLRTSGDSSLEFSPIPESQRDGPAFPEDRARRSQSLPPLPFMHGMHRSCEGYRLDHAFEDGLVAGAGQDASTGDMLSSSHGAGQSMKQLQLNYTDFFPDYFSLAEKPPAEFCLSPDGNTESISIDLLQKKGLVKAINTAVDLIVAHFGTSRDPGVKAKLGNSSVSPNVGHLILKYLCPAIRDVLSDGLKAYVLDMIVGQRRNIPWSVVEASTQLGPSTKLLHSLCSKVSQHTELTSHSMRFNAFIFGLLNIRSLEFWFNHLYNHEDIILAHYQPTGFLCLSHGVCQPLFEELLLLLQPLSLLPFSLDLLFEHRLLQMGKEQQQQKELLRVKQDLVLSAHSTLQLMRSRAGDDSDGWRAAPARLPLEPVGGRERATGVGAPCEEREPEEERRKAVENAGESRKDKQAGWWYQLMQSSQVYIEGSAEGSKFLRYERRRKGLGSAPRRAPPPREGVVEGAEACPLAEAPLERRPNATLQPPEEARERSRPFWMGSPPDSVLSELKCSKEKEKKEKEVTAAPGPGAAPSEGPSTPDSSLPVKWGHLFGARKAQKESKQPNRLPSGWLSLDRSVLQRVVQTVGASMWRDAAPDPGQVPMPAVEPKQLPARGLSPELSCEVKALCHHIATEAGQLSFNKGDLLRVLAKVDGDWLRCGLGADTGLVPIMYVTHPEDEDY
ncbi:AP-4 complex accessory subunit RUSC2 isoform X3 [Alligator mississippiensis]|uniref:AP-4 complex accessory subunit RUSC2 isoform X3 n=1 Tax=Alligator mississippiensis TaxID=8496 RepID=UPI002877B5D5|nr:AP-4 complex accessory subunit RUSC2 isoform X3 [Alligator mississippiensis]